jgi:hypothetical protein
MSKIADLEEPLARALAFARAIELMGFGLSNLDDDLTAAFVTTAEHLIDELKAAKKICRRNAAVDRRRHR